MKHLRKFNESANSDITFGSIVKFKEGYAPRPDLINAEFIVKVDGEYNDFGKGEWVIMYQVRPNLSDLDVKEIIDCYVPISNDTSDADWYKLGNIVNFMPVKVQKWRIDLIK